MTLIHIWDKKSDMLLSLKYDPLKIGHGEPGMTSVAAATNTSSSMTISTLTSSSSTSPSSKKRKERGSKATFEINEVLGTMMKFFRTDSDMNSIHKVNKVSEGKAVGDTIKSIDQMSLDELFNINEQYQNHLKFMKEMDMCDDEMKNDVVNKIK